MGFGDFAMGVLGSIKNQIDSNYEKVEKAHDRGMNMSKSGLLKSISSTSDPLTRTGYAKAYRDQYGDDENLRKAIRR